MAKRKVADMTLAQKTAHENAKFRAEQFAHALEADKAARAALAKARKANTQ